jgi:hypothetical protein
MATKEMVKAFREQPPFSPDQKITVLVSGNPKRSTAAQRWTYHTGMTVWECMVLAERRKFPLVHGAKTNAELAMMDMRWDHNARFIDIK